MLFNEVIQVISLSALIESQWHYEISYFFMHVIGELIFICEHWFREIEKGMRQ